VRLFHSQLLAGFDRRTFRFTIRDLLWLTLVVALIVGWWVDRRAIQRQSAIEFNDMRRDFIFVTDFMNRNAVPAWDTAFPVVPPAKAVP